MKTVTISAPLCAPTRQAITGTVRKQLAQYHFDLGGIDAQMIRQGKTPLYWRVSVTFSDDAAAWGEYCLLRYNYGLLSRPINPKNKQWAEQYLGGNPWYETGCKDRPKNAPPSEMPQANPPTPWEVRHAREQKRRLSPWDRIKEMIR
jgi:hypothetical protein